MLHFTGWLQDQHHCQSVPWAEGLNSKLTHGDLCSSTHP